jgi:beta-lactamase regulating signal transducer with metallopeptidase domain
LEPYLLNVALHAVALSAASIVIVALIRNPRAKAGVALGCLLAVGGLSWLSPLRPTAAPALSIPILPPPPAEVIPMSPPPSIETARLTESLKDAPLPTGHRVKFPSQEIVPLLWAAGTLAGLLGIAASLGRDGRWQASLAPVGERERILIEESLPREIDHDIFRISEEPISPCVAGFLTPRIVIPRSLLDGSKPRELAWALRHELTHFDGHDSRWAVAIACLRAAFWWNPLVHGLARTWSEERERTCDQVAATQATERADYGDFLVTMAATLSPRPARGPAMARHGRAKRLKRRVAFLLAAAPGQPPGVSRLQSGGCGLVFAAALGATSLLALEQEKPVERTGNRSLTLEKILNPEPVIGVSMVWVKSAEPFGETGRIYTAEELRQRITQLRKLPGTQLESTAPVGTELDSIEEAISVLFNRSFQQKDVTWVFNAASENEIPVETLPRERGSRVKDHAGWVIGLGTPTESIGNKIRIPIDASYSFFPGRHLASALQPTGAWKDVRQIEKSADFEMSSGHAEALDFGEVEPGVHIALVVRGRIAPPWEHPFEPLDFDSMHFATMSAARFDESRSGTLAVQSRINRLLVRLENRPLPADPEYRRLEKLRDEARLAYQIAMDSLPTNQEFVRHRNIQLRKLGGKSTDREAMWKLKQLTASISAHAESNRHTLSLKQDWEALSRAAEVHLKQLQAVRYFDIERHFEEKSRRMLEDFERRRHEW